MWPVAGPNQLIWNLQSKNFYNNFVPMRKFDQRLIARLLRVVYICPFWELRWAFEPANVISNDWHWQSNNSVENV
ncbi:unnamed protein product [Clonostachys chloroleuca]|uniref:Uncharacterized protein n=1 Tax=Clonostachys chloroleuca TaxID=1926264 RepID=A0AA35VHX3_9HYPO|nr:unnamed protein product [Clonostachys chloroleuca]